MDLKITYIVSILFVVTSIYSYTAISELKDENKTLLVSKKALENELFNLNNKFQHMMSLSESENQKLLEELKKKSSQKIVKKDKDTDLKKLANSFNVSSMLIPESIESMSDDELKNNLNKFLKLKDEDLPSNMGLREFINNLIKIAMVDDLSNDDSIHIPEEQKKFNVIVPLPEDPKELDSMFNQPKDENVKSISLNKTNKVTAMLDLNDVESERVLVKWLNKDDGKVISYEYVEVKPNEVNALSFERKNNLQEGNYEVKVFTTNNEIAQIASTNFIVK